MQQLGFHRGIGRHVRRDSISVDSYFSNLEERGVEVGPLANRDYGMEDFLVVDPWGNRLVFGEPEVVPR